MIYYHIGEKKALYNTVLNSTFGNMAAVMSKNILLNKEPAENLHIYIQTISKAIRENPQSPLSR